MRRDVLRLEAALAEARADAIRECVAVVGTFEDWYRQQTSLAGPDEDYINAVDDILTALRALLPEEEQA